MKLLKRKHSIRNKVGKPPGTLIYLSEKQLERTTISFVEYDENDYTLKRDVSFPELKKLVESEKDGKKSWININGLHNIDIISQIGELFNIHSLILEDITNTYQRPKVDYYDDDVFLVMKKLKLNSDQSLEADQVCLLLKDGYLITFTNEDEPGFENIFRRIETGKKVLRRSGIDYLFYVVIDLVVDNYFVLNEEIHDKLENLEDKLLEDPEPEDLNQIQIYKKSL